MSTFFTSTYHQSRSLCLRRPTAEDASILYQRMYSNNEFMSLFRPNDAPVNEEELRIR